jgi:hypothetical protein
MNEQEKYPRTYQAHRQREKESRERQLSSLLLGARCHNPEFISQGHPYHRDVKETDKKGILSKAIGKIETSEYRRQENAESLRQRGASSQDGDIPGETPLTYPAVTKNTSSNSACRLLCSDELHHFE